MNDKWLGYVTVFFIFCAGISFLLMPAGFRSGVIPNINSMISECEENKVELENLKKIISEHNDRFWKHGHNYYDGSTEYPNARGKK